MREERVIKKKGRREGFSLIELMFSAAILLTVITGALLTYTHCILLNDSSHNLTKAANDAQYVLEQIKGLPYGSIASYTAPVFNNLKNESITLGRSIGANLATVTVNVNWQERQSARTFSITARFAN